MPSTINRLCEVSGDLGDIIFATDTFHRNCTEKLDTSVVANLSVMQGSGAVREFNLAVRIRKAGVTQ